MLEKFKASGYRTAFSASASGRHQNQDAHRSLTIEEDGLNAVIVCDGVGSLELSGEAAEKAAEAARDILCEEGVGAIAIAFERAHHCIVESLQGNGQTTMIILTERLSGIFGHFIGNGAILQLTGVPEKREDGKQGVRVQWTNHLVPRIIYQSGRDYLEPVLGSKSLDRAQPDFVEISRRRFPQLILAVTDGILSREQVIIGRTSTGERWEKLNTPLWEVLAFGKEVIELLYANPKQQVCADQLRSGLQGRLDRLAVAGSLDDDATVGVFLCAE